MEMLLAASGVHVAVMSVVSAQMLECNSPWQWMCNNGECIAQYDLCNGIAQCSDASDEADCALRNSQQNYMGVPREEQMKPSTSKPMVQNSTTASLNLFNISSVDVRWLALIGVVLLLFIAIVYVRFRKRRGLTNNRAYGLRRGNNTDEDEDDLLISSMYS